MALKLFVLIQLRITQSRTEDSNAIQQVTAVRLEVEENQLVGIFSKIGVVVDALKGA
jgi:hypothetical protein